MCRQGRVGVDQFFSMDGPLREDSAEMNRTVVSILAIWLSVGSGIAPADAASRPEEIALPAAVGGELSSAGWRTR